MRFRVLTYLGCVGALVIVSMMQAAAQPRFARQPFNRWSIELQTGWNIPFSPSVPEKSTFQYNRLGGWQAGVRYMVIPQLGIRPFYAYSNFGSSAAGQLQLHQYGGELVLNLAEAFSPIYAGKPRRVNLLLHGGGAFARAHSRRGINGEAVPPQNMERILNAQVGVTPQYRLGSFMAVYFDLTAQFSVFKDYGFDGSPVRGRSSKLQPGFILTPSLGVQFYLGAENQHADWR